MSEGEPTNESSRRFPFRAILGVSDGLLALACLVAFIILLSLLPSLRWLSISSSLAPFMNATALVCGLLVPLITFTAAAIMLPQKVALSRVGAKIGLLSDAALLPAVVAIYWLARMHPYIPIPPMSIRVAFIFYVITSLLLLALHICYIVTTRRDSMRGGAKWYGVLLALVAVNGIIVTGFILHIPLLQNGPNLADYGQHWIAEMARRVLYSSDGLSLGFMFQVLAVLIASVLFVTGRRQCTIMGSVCAIAAYASMLLPLALTYRETSDHDPFSIEPNSLPSDMGIDAEFIVQAGAIATCLLILHIAVLVRNLLSSKTTRTEGAHSDAGMRKPTSFTEPEAVKEREPSMDLPREASTHRLLQHGYAVVLMTVCLALIIALAYSFALPLVNPDASSSSTWGAVFWAVPLSCLLFAVTLLILHAKHGGYAVTMRTLERATLGFYCCYAALMGPGLVILAAFANSETLTALVIIFCLSQIGIAIALIVSAGSNEPTRKATRTALYVVLILLLLALVLAWLIPILTVIAHGRNLADYSYLVESGLTGSLPPLLFLLTFTLFTIRKRP